MHRIREIMVLRRLYHLLLELVELPEVFLSARHASHSLVLIYVEIVELAW